MKQISGYVFVKETNFGVPNLVVTAYDSEKSIREIVGGDLGSKNFSLGDLGKRIGSVLTDQAGNFILKSEDLEFQGNESRPDLLIIIFAPEDIQNLETPYPLPPEERILYISTLPREDAGAEEAFVIRLLQAQLDHFGITIAASANESNTDIDRLASAIESTWNFRDGLRDRLSPKLREEQKKSEEYQNIAYEKVKNLSAIPTYLRDDGLRNNQLLINGKQDLAENLKVKQDQVIATGLERLQTRDSVMHLRLTETDLNDLGLQVKDGKIVGEVDPQKLTEKVGSLIKGFDLVRKRGLNNPSPEELIKKYLLEKPAPVDVKANNSSE
jgi:hypothetical protein